MYPSTIFWTFAQYRKKCFQDYGKIMYRYPWYRIWPCPQHYFLMAYTINFGFINLKLMHVTNVLCFSLTLRIQGFCGWPYCFTFVTLCNNISNVLAIRICESFNRNLTTLIVYPGNVLIVSPIHYWEFNWLIDFLDIKVLPMGFIAHENAI